MTQDRAEPRASSSRDVDWARARPGHPDSQAAASARRSRSASSRLLAATRSRLAAGPTSAKSFSQSFASRSHPPGIPQNQIGQVNRRRAAQASRRHPDDLEGSGTSPVRRRRSAGRASSGGRWSFEDASSRPPVDGVISPRAGHRASPGDPVRSRARPGFSIQVPNPPGPDQRRDLGRPGRDRRSAGSGRRRGGEGGLDRSRVAISATPRPTRNERRLAGVDVDSPYGRSSPILRLGRIRRRRIHGTAALP